MQETELCAAADISPDTLAAIERGERRVTPVMLLRLAKVLGALPNSPPESTAPEQRKEPESPRQESWPPEAQEGHRNELRAVLEWIAQTPSPASSDPVPGEPGTAAGMPKPREGVSESEVEGPVEVAAISAAGAVGEEVVELARAVLRISRSPYRVQALRLALLVESFLEALEGAWPTAASQPSGDGSAGLVR